METIRLFKINETIGNESSKNCDWVQLYFDEQMEYPYIVIWKWTTMKKPLAICYKCKNEAMEKYNDRKEFAILCN